MEKSSVEAIVTALNRGQVRYLIAGGLAVVAHGLIRLTTDVDLILAVDEPNLRRAVEALKTLDYRPRAPVAFEEFADAGLRRKWASEKGMVVFSVFSPQHGATEVDLFLEPPLDFDAAHGRAARMEVAPGVAAAFCAIDDLIEIKRRAGRPIDLKDVAELRRLQNEEMP